MNPTDPFPAQADECKHLGGRIWFWLCLISVTFYISLSEGIHGHIAFLSRAVRKVFEHLA